MGPAAFDRGEERKRAALVETMEDDLQFHAEGEVRLVHADDVREQTDAFFEIDGREHERRAQTGNRRAVNDRIGIERRPPRARRPHQDAVLAERTGGLWWEMTAIAGLAFRRHEAALLARLPERRVGAGRIMHQRVGNELGHARPRTTISV
jgi:hypothetical protein